MLPQFLEHKLPGTGNINEETTPPIEPLEETMPTLEPPGLSPKEILEWTFLLDTLNFCFWSDKATLFTFSYGGEKWTGYRSLCAALTKAVEDGIPIFKPSYYATISEASLETIFKSDTHVQLPLIGQRRKNLLEAASVLNEVRVHFSREGALFGGSIYNTTPGLSFVERLLFLERFLLV